MKASRFSSAQEPFIPQLLAEIEVKRRGEKPAVSPRVAAPQVGEAGQITQGTLVD